MCFDTIFVSVLLFQTAATPPSNPSPTLLIMGCGRDKSYHFSYCSSGVHRVYRTECSFRGLSADRKGVLLLQKKALSIIASVGHFKHCWPVFQRIGILTVYSLYVSNSLPQIKENCSAYDKRQDVHTYNTRGAEDLNIQQCRLTKSQKCFPVPTVKLFDRLPEEIRDKGKLNISCNQTGKY